MALISVITLVASNILYHLVFMQKYLLCLHITADISKISRSVQYNITCIFNDLSGTVNDFV